MLEGGCTVNVKIRTQGNGKVHLRTSLNKLLGTSFFFQVKKMVSGVNNGCTGCAFSPAQYNNTDVIASGTELNRSFSYNMEVCTEVIFYMI